MGDTEPQKGAKAKITVVLPDEVLRAVQQRARRKGVAASVLIRMWVMERLEREQER